MVFFFLHRLLIVLEVHQCSRASALLFMVFFLLHRLLIVLRYISTFVHGVFFFFFIEYMLVDLSNRFDLPCNDLD